MKILFIADPIENFKIYKDTTYAMMQEAHQRGHDVYHCQPHDLAWTQKVGVQALARQVHLQSQHQTWYQLSEASDCPLQAFDAVLQRKDPPFDMEYIYSIYLLELAEQQGAKVFNRSQAIRSHNEKISIAQFPLFTAPTLITASAKRLREFHQQHGDVILKPLDGMGGAGIFRIGVDGLNLGSIIETLTRHGQQTIMAQRYIPAITQGDKRILLIGGKLVPYALARIPQQGEVRGNLAAGGQGVVQALSERDKEIAETVAPILWQQGLFLVGLDVIGDYLTEINVTSPTGFQEITKQTGFSVASMWMDALEQAV